MGHLSDIHIYMGEFFIHWRTVRFSANRNSVVTAFKRPLGQCVKGNHGGCFMWIRICNLLTAGRGIEYHK